MNASTNLTDEYRGLIKSSVLLCNGNHLKLDISGTTCLNHGCCLKEELCVRAEMIVQIGFYSWTFGGYLF